MEQRRGFSLVELVVCVVVAGGLLVLLVPSARQARLDPGLAVSLNNVQLIMAACAAYQMDTGRVPMRGAQYTNGQLSGWDSWNFGGKNGVQNWPSIFDESAYSRPLNGYLYPDVQVPVPTGYVNTGSGATWTFNHGLPTLQQRQTLQLPVYKSPGDVATYQGAPGSGVPFGSPNPNLSSYQDVGTSYHLNMVWWGHPSLTGTFTQRYNTGTNLISTVAPDHYVWISDQVGALVPHGYSVPGEFGGTNMSVVGFMDGRAEYIEFVPNAMSGPGYTLWPGGRTAVRPGLEVNRR